MSGEQKEISLITHYKLDVGCELRAYLSCKFLWDRKANALFRMQAQNTMRQSLSFYFPCSWSKPLVYIFSCITTIYNSIHVQWTSLELPKLKFYRAISIRLISSLVKVGLQYIAAVGMQQWLYHDCIENVPFHCRLHWSLRFLTAWGKCYTLLYNHCPKHLISGALLYISQEKSKWKMANYTVDCLWRNCERTLKVINIIWF